MAEEIHLVLAVMVDQVVAQRVQDIHPTLLAVLVMKEVIRHQKEILAVLHPTRVTDMEEVAAVVTVPLVETRDLMVLLVVVELVFVCLQHSEIQTPHTDHQDLLEDSMLLVEVEVVLV